MHEFERRSILFDARTSQVLEFEEQWLIIQKSLPLNVNQEQIQQSRMTGSLWTNQATNACDQEKAIETTLAERTE